MATVANNPSLETKPKPSSIQQATPLFVLGLLLWFGLLSSVVEVLLHSTLKRVGVRWYLRLSQDYIWMTAVMDALIFLVPGAILAFMAWRLRRNFVPAALFIGSFLFVGKCLILMGHLHRIALILLTLGLAVQTVRLFKGNIHRIKPFVYRSTVILALMFTALAAVQVGGRIYTERQELAQLPPTPTHAPNVILIVLDTVGANHTSLHGYHRQTTPNLDAWAKKGTWFKRAMVTAPWTLPSHASMFTGRYPQELSATWATPLDTAYPTVAEALRNQGYETAGFVANRYYTGYDSGLSRGFIHWEDYNYSLGEFIHCSALSKWFCNQMVVRNFMEWFDVYGRKNGADVNQTFLTWLDARDERPFFAFLNFFDAHDPYLPPPPFDSKFGPPPTAEDGSLSIQWWKLKRLDLPPERIDAAIQAHDSCIAYLDDQLGKLRKELEQRGLLDNTVIIITSDHGEHFGEHGLYLHGQSLYRDLIHVPLVMIHPGKIPANSVVEDFVTLRDLPATILDIARVPSSDRIPGHSWSRFWEKNASSTAAGSPLFQVALPIPRGYACPDHGCSPVASGPIVSLFNSGKYYIRNTETGKEEIYDFDSDPLELNNLALLPENEPLLEDFRAAVQQMFAVHKSRWVDFP